jgi:RNA recognition motif-containing protein
MSYTVFLGNLPLWVTADDIKSWLTADNLVADNVKVIRNPETQESKGFAFIDSPNQEEMNSIIRRFDRAPLEERLLRANPAQPPKPKGSVKPAAGAPPQAAASPSAQPRPEQQQRDPRPRTTSGPPKTRPARRPQGPASAFAEELAKAL